MRSLTLLVAILLPMVAMGKVVRTETPTTILYNITVEDFEKQEVVRFGKNYLKTVLKGVGPYEGMIHEVGRPEVPVIRLFVEGDADVRVTSAQREVPNTYSSLPPLIAERSIRKRPGSHREPPRLVAPTIEEFNRVKKDFEIIPVGKKRGITRRLVTLYPVQWDPHSGAEKRVHRFSVEVSKRLASPNAPARGEIIVIPEVFKENEALKRWLTLKSSQGISTQMLFVDRESAEEIRSALANLYKTYPETRSVLLVGDLGLIPSHTTSLLSGYTDHYYAALDETYETDLASPDVIVGRLPIENEVELTELLNRFLRYAALSPKTRWLKKNSLVATNDKEFWKPTEESFTQMIEKYFSPKGFLGSFPKLKLKGGDKLFAYTHKATGEDLKEALSDGRGLIFYSGHGLPGEWEAPALKARELADLDLGKSHPFVFALACQTGKFDEASIAEAWVKAENGAISSVGSYADTYWDEDFILQKELVDAFMARGLSVGEALESAKEEVWRRYGGKEFSNYYLETYHLFSDPALRLRVH